MPVTCKEDKRQLTALVAGELDHHQAKAVMAELNRRIDLAQPRQLTLDLSGLTFTDSSGIAVLLRAHRRMGQVQGVMRVVNTPAQAEKVFKAAGLEKIIKFE
ncbi:MAG: anti-sigma factor antagonist [Lawsonibacter sp.]|jgi:stage II sporulation protein AA (anti-sigma F factor antagonist)|nr:anti-sigma factor antagonist [Lawsonibacter sp.]